MRIRLFTWILLFSVCIAGLYSGTLTVTQDGGGDGFIRVNGTDQTLPFSQSYPGGTSLSLEAVPADYRSRFDWWSGSIDGTDNPVTFTMPVFGNVSVTASFSLSPPDIGSVWPWWSLGSAAVGSTVYSDISISNAGGETLVVVSMSFTGTNASEFFIANATQSFNLTPGTDHTLTVGFHPAGSGNRVAYLNIVSNDPDENPFLLAVEATAYSPDIASNPSGWDFGAVNIGAHSDKIFAVRNAGTGILNVSATSLTGQNPAEFDIRSGGGSFQLDEGMSRDITVRFSPTGTGVKKALLTLNSDDPDENPFNVDLIGTGTANPVETAPDIASNPSEWNFGTVNNGSHADQVFAIRNNGNANLNISSTTLTGVNASEFSIRSGGGAFTLAPGAARDVTVRFSPASSGDKHASMTLTSNDPDENPFPIALNGTGQTSAGAPDIDVSPASLNISNSGALDLVIMNTGTSDLTFSILENNLLENGGFESGFEPWIEEDYVNAGSIVRDSSQLHSGSWSVKSTGDHLVNDWELQLKQCGFQIADRQAYTVSFWGKAQKVRTLSTGLCKETADWSDISERHIVSLTPSWQYFAYTLHVSIPSGVPNPLPPADTRFFFSGIGTDLTTFWIDDVKLQIPEEASGWLNSKISRGVVGSGSLQTVQILFNSCVMANGTYQADLFVDSNDPDEPSITIPVTMTVTTTSVENNTNENIPRSCSILRNCPNPFNPGTQIFFSVSKPVEVKISICDMLGRRVKTFTNKQYSPGTHEIEWDGMNDQCHPAGSGIYFFVLSDGSRTQSKKLIKLE